MLMAWRNPRQKSYVSTIQKTLEFSVGLVGCTTYMIPLERGKHRWKRKGPSLQLKLTRMDLSILSMTSRFPGNSDLDSIQVVRLSPKSKEELENWFLIFKMLQLMCNVAYLSPRDEAVKNSFSFSHV
ncbi:hypothetical protein RHSIM_RhsimUnG0200400 [Rhododendron simsii]|uniref:Uncharacterized protein n=1 Tax=Rhododendron simsii TaxID=118357 RepID=A0A834FZ17_RHOSS|nr:hypothetical protein RHSIM_RhsimUnG0200400 [Rhododendron simsii]